MLGFLVNIVTIIVVGQIHFALVEHTQNLSLFHEFNEKKDIRKKFSYSQNRKKEK